MTPEEKKRLKRMVNQALQTGSTGKSKTLMEGLKEKPIVRTTKGFENVPKLTSEKRTLKGHRTTQGSEKSTGKYKTLMEGLKEKPIIRTTKPVAKQDDIYQEIKKAFKNTRINIHADEENVPKKRKNGSSGGHGF